ncbi:helix-turn-helix domain-containing protein [Streptococcus pyogenes]|nr:helix-turn-helix transcriptional regulator [Streptococcus pyogenes NGAS128]HES1887356.1 helix-turn-helix transcriptional regulator [Streptococcus pyogenes]
MNVGERIKQRRKELKISADFLAEKVGVSRSTIFRYEKGEIEKVGPEVLKDIAKALNTTPSYLMGWENDQPQTDSETLQYKMIQRKAKSLSVSDQERLLQLMDLTFQDILNGGGDDEHDF